MDSFSALADPGRRRILKMLAARGNLSASEIGSKFSISAPAVSQHLKILREAGLVRMEKKAQQRIYSLEQGGLNEMEEWILQMKQFWNSRLDVLEELLETKKPIPNNKPKKKP